MSNITWRSQLGSVYDRSDIEKNDAKTQAELDRLRNLPENRSCADCGCTNGTVVASVNLGVFLCEHCGSIHREVGTHISKTKGCTGSYLWGADEVERMRQIGNAVANKKYGGHKYCPAKGSGDEVWRKFVVEKYEQRKFALAGHGMSPPLSPKHRPDQARDPDEPLSEAKRGLVSSENRDAPPIKPNSTSMSLATDDFFSSYGL